MEFTCIECETLYDDTDGDTDERMCNKCLDRIFDEDLERQSKKQVKSFMNKIDKFIKYFAQQKSQRPKEKKTQIE